MNTITHKKIEKNLYNIVSKIIYEDINDSKISFPTVTGVVLSRDKSHLKIYLTFNSYPKQSLENIQKVKGFIKMQMSQYTSMRKIPQIYLLLDETFEKGQNIERILKKIHDKK